MKSFQIIGVLCAWMAAAFLPSHAYTLRQLDNADGLSNSAVLSVSQDERGFMWIGTCDGLNIYDGRDISRFSAQDADSGLTGDLIERVLECPDGSFWVMTNYGLNHVAVDGHVDVYPLLTGLDNLVTDEHGTLLAVSEDGRICYFDSEGSAGFEWLADRQAYDAAGEIKGLFCTGSKLLVFGSDGIAELELSRDSGRYSAVGHTVIGRYDLSGAYIHGDDIYLTGRNGELYSFDVSSGKIRYLVDLHTLIGQRGVISDIAADAHGCLLIGFATGGVLRMTFVGGNSRVDPFVEDLGVKGGVFCLYPDRFQDVVWIGSDGHGLYVYANDTYSLRSITYPELGNAITHPIRSVYLDDAGTLWLGTKGDGLLMIRDFNPWGRGKSYPVRLLTTSNSGLTDNSVYAIVPSRCGGVWIGHEEGLDYAAADGSVVRSVKSDRAIRYVHGIYEADDTTLWLATVGMGVIKARIGGTDGNPAVKVEKVYTIENGNFASNFFFGIHHGADGNIWVGNRGFGLFEICGDDIMPVTFRGEYPTATVKDVFSVTGDKGDLWVGTGFGLINLMQSGERSWLRDQGFPDSTIHTLLTDDNGNVWVSTNRGLVCVDRKSGNYRTFTHSSGLDVLEFSDGAAFKAGPALLFGGVNGLSVVTENRKSAKVSRQQAEYRPDIQFTRLNIAGSDVRVRSRISSVNGKSFLRLKPDENTFSVSFVVPDYMAADNYTYLYRLDHEKEWIQVTTPGTVSFTSMPYGDYTLELKAVNHSSGVETDAEELHLHIAPPWYLSWWAKTCYAMLAAILLSMAWMRRRRLSRMRQEAVMKRIEQEHKEKSYEDKLRFFTNITHEFCTPLTLIYGPCERILSYGEADPYVRRYASLIKNNTERLNSLIQEIIDFRRVETGNQKLQVKNLDISDLCREIVASFEDLRDRLGVGLESEIEDGIIWPTDYGCFTKIVYNLISNAFKYTPAGGTVRVGLEKSGGMLHLSVYNTGKGIRPEDRERIFNRYSILDNVEENATRSLSSRNGLGMAICHSMTELLQGRIEIESEVGSYAMFIVSLPPLEVSHDAAGSNENTVAHNPMPVIADLARNDIAESSVREVKPQFDAAEEDNAGKRRILVIDDNPDILTLMTDSLSEYSVLTAGSAQEGLDVMKRHSPDLIITDIMMPGIDGIELTRLIKQDRHMRHIPLVILSARNTTDDRVEGLQSGADAYVPKPFSFSYLRAVIVRLLKGKNEMEEYYNSSASAFHYHHGKLVSNEDRMFVESLNEYVNANIDNPGLSPASMADHMQTSVRGLYRKMKDLQLLPPNDFIKDHRLNYATKLLVTTSLTIQEILYRCGFTNRSHFYKEFDRRHGMTPKDYRNAHRSGNDSADAAGNL